MLEPTTASIAIYLLTKTSSITDNKNCRLFVKKPFYFKRKICKWIFYNKNELLDIIIDENNEKLLDLINNINTIKYINPSIFLLLYIFMLFLVIIF